MAAKDAKKKDKPGPLSVSLTPSRVASLFPKNKFPAIQFISREQVPSNRRFSSHGIRDIPAVRQFREVLEEVSKHQEINPYEIAAELDLSSPEAQEVIKERRVFATSLRRVLKELLEEFKLDDKLMITSSDKSSRFFLVGKSDVSFHSAKE